MVCSPKAQLGWGTAAKVIRESSQILSVPCCWGSSASALVVSPIPSPPGPVSSLFWVLRFSSSFDWALELGISHLLAVYHKYFMGPGNWCVLKKHHLCFAFQSRASLQTFSIHDKAVSVGGRGLILWSQCKMTKKLHSSLLIRCTNASLYRTLLDL